MKFWFFSRFWMTIASLYENPKSFACIRTGFPTRMRGLARGVQGEVAYFDYPPSFYTHWIMYFCQIRKYKNASFKAQFEGMVASRPNLIFKLLYSQTPFVHSMFQICSPCYNFRSHFRIFTLPLLFQFIVATLPLRVAWTITVPLVEVETRHGGNCRPASDVVSYQRDLVSHVQGSDARFLFHKGVSNFTFGISR